jgi:excisionase family DNA binding protein
MVKQRVETDELIEVRQAARLVGRHPETIRRWVWSGRLSAERRGRQLLVGESDVRSLAGDREVTMSLGQWAERARAWRASTATGSEGRSAADLVVEDRDLRSAEGNYADRR